MITQEYLKSQLHYNPETGIFTWIASRKKIQVNSIAGYLSKKNNYYYIGLDLKKYKLHRLAWFYVYGEWPSVIDHIDGNPLNNKLSNLRKCTFQQNMLNQKLRKDNTSGVKGIRLSKNGKWRVLITENKIKHHIGYFNDFFEACCAAYSNRIRLHKEFTRHI